MKYFIAYLFICLPVFLPAQATQFIVESFQLELNDLEANRNPVYDANDEKCALIKVRTDLDNLTFSSNNGIVEQKKVLTEYWLYVSYDEKKLNIYKEGYIPLNFQIPLSLEESKVYTFYLTSSKRFSIVIQTEPKDAQIYFDEQLVREPNISEVSPGKHMVKIAHDGYRTILDTINVEDGSIFFSYTLEKLEPVVVTISTEPEGSAILINKDYRGLTPKQLFLYPDEYDIQLSNEFYQDVNETITVSKNKQNTFFYKLKTNISYLQVFSYPQNAIIYCDGKKISEKTKIEAGEHIIETRSDLYYTDKRIVNIPPGRDTTITVSLQAKSGNLQFTVNPIDAEVNLFKGEELLHSWSGAKRIEELQIGDYRIVADAKKFRKVERQIVIKENSTEELFLDLAHGKKSDGSSRLTSVALSAVIPGLGQYYSGNIPRSVIYSISGVGTGALALFYNSKFNKTYDNYQESKIAYDNSTTLTDIRASRDEMYNYYNDLEILDRQRQVFFISFVTIYSINVIDAMFFGKDKERETSSGENRTGKMHIHPFPLYGGLGLQIRYTF